MNPRIANRVIIALAAALLVGCGGNTYKPNAVDTQLASYAGQATYPRNLTPMRNPDLFCSVAPDATITLWNAGDNPVSGFEVWINQMYTLHLDKLDARDSISLDPATIYNKTGANLKGVPANSINTVQIQQQDKLWDVHGPIIQH
jgi:hypothetical protein